MRVFASTSATAMTLLNPPGRHFFLTTHYSFDTFSFFKHLLSPKSPCCIMLHHIALGCIILHHVASYCIRLHHIASNCIMLHHISRVVAS